MWAVWWIWIVAGFALGVLEVLVPGYVFLGFAIGAISTGLLLGLGVLGGAPAFVLLIFAVASLAAWLGLRKILGQTSGQVKIWHKDIND
jgi:membrane protein implicated in regulation of membrane protease activity